MANSNTTIIEQCRISPAADHPDSKAEFSRPIVFYDMLFLRIPLGPFVYFFEFPCSTSHFLEQIVPGLKRSLSLALAHFLPIAGNIVHTTSTLDDANENLLVLRYLPGDSVSFTVSKSNADLNHLAADYARVSNQFYQLAPLSLPATHAESYVISPVFAIQVTLFPGQGISIGFVRTHVIGDFQTISMFMRAWALIHSAKLMTLGMTSIGVHLAEAKCLPFYERQDFQHMTTSKGLSSIYWDQALIRSPSPVEASSVKVPDADRVRTTLVLKKEEIQKLKEYYSTITTSLDAKDLHLSSFVVACALVWTCLARSAGENIVADDDPETFIFAANCRGRIPDVHTPENYFGNCLSWGYAELKHGELIGNNGFVMAVESIAKAIKERLYGGNGILDGVEEWSRRITSVKPPVVFVAGSPKMDIYGADFGWGKAKKFEALNIDGRCFSLYRSRNFDGSLEIGVSRQKLQMEAFYSILTQLLGDFVNAASAAGS